MYGICWALFSSLHLKCLEITSLQTFLYRVYNLHKKCFVFFIPILLFLAQLYGCALNFACGGMNSSVLTGTVKNVELNWIELSKVTEAVPRVRDEALTRGRLQTRGRGRGGRGALGSKPPCSRQVWL